MALTPVFALGWENGILEGNAANGVNLPTVSNTKARTGTYSLRSQGTGTDSYGRTLATPLSNLQLAAAFNHNGISTSSAVAVIFRLIDVSAVHYAVEWLSNGTLRMRKGSTTLDTADPSALSVVDTWHDLSVAWKASGWFDFYVNGVLTLSAESSDVGSDAISSVMVGGRGSGNDLGWGNFLYTDDVRCLDATGEAQSRPASTRRYLWAQANGNGQTNEWAGSDGDSTDNYALVDDGVSPDGDTTYVKATSAGKVDQYTHGGVTVPADWVPVRVWPTVIGEKTDAGIDTTLKLGLWKDSSDDDSAELDLPVTYGLVQAPFTALPDASTLNETNINSTEIRLVSAGDYA